MVNFTFTFTNKIQNGDILVLANPGALGKWLLKWRVTDGKEPKASKNEPALSRVVSEIIGTQVLPRRTKLNQNMKFWVLSHL